MADIQLIQCKNQQKSEKKNFVVDGLTAGTAPSSRSCDTKTMTNIENPARSNLDIVL